MEQDKQETGTPATRGSSAWRRGWMIAGGLTVLTLGGLAAATAVNAAGGPGGCFGRAGGHPGGPFAGRGLDRVLEKVEATPEQEKRIWAIVDAARAELRPVAREFRETRGTVVGLLGAETVDRAAAEKLRAERIAAIDAASKRLTEAVLDAADVLTPEQRATLAKHVEERGFGERGPRR